MALTIQQRRHRATFFGVIIAVCVIAFIMKDPIQRNFFTPPGYQRHAPAGNYSMLDWGVMKQVQVNRGRKMNPPPVIAALGGKLVCIRGYIIPLNDNPLTEQRTAKPFITEQPSRDLSRRPPVVISTVQAIVAGGQELQVITTPVTVYGTLNLTHDWNTGTLYTIDDAVLVPDRK